MAAPALDLSSAEHRAALADEYGFEQIGAPVPAGVTLQDVINSLPAEARREKRAESNVLADAAFRQSWSTDLPLTLL